MRLMDGCVAAITGPRWHDLRWLWIAAAGVVVGIALVTIVGWVTQPDPAHDAELGLELASAIARTQDGELLALRSVTDAEFEPLEWDRVHIFAPYSTPELIEQELGFGWAASADHSINMSDAIHLLVFVRNDAVVRFTELSRDFGNFAGPDLAGGYTPNEAVFAVVRASGQLTLRLAPG